MNSARERIHRVIVLLHCALFYLFHGPAKKRIKNPKVIVVALSGKLGDVVCGTPVLRVLRENFPAARLVAAGGNVMREVLENGTLVDAFLSLDMPGSFGELKKLSADAAISTGLSFCYAANFYLSGIPLVVVPKVVGGYSPFETWPFKILRRALYPFPFQMGAYAPMERLRSLEALGVNSRDTKKKLGYSEMAAKAAAEYFSANKLTGLVVGISPSAGNKIKEWPTSRFAEVADHLVEKYGARVVIFGGRDDAEKVTEVISHMRLGASALNLGGKLNLDELKAFISKLSLFIAVDTGPIYIAEAFGVPTVDIVGPMNENEQPPQGPNHVSVVPKRAKPELSILNARIYDVAEAKRQVLSISTEEVKSAADALMRKISLGGNRI